MKTYSKIDYLFKDIQVKIRKEETYKEAIDLLLELRNLLMDLNSDSLEKQIWDDYTVFSKNPLKSDKTIAYYLYHLTRIEDITSNVLINNSPQIFFKDNYCNLINSPITTTGNELEGEEIIKFSEKINYEQLKKYRMAVFNNTNEIIKNLDYINAKKKVNRDNLLNIVKQKSISNSPNAIWLLDYWGSKDYIGLMLMPFSRHQMLHLNGCLRIINKLKTID